jgi:hypothetical protein
MFSFGMIETDRDGVPSWRATLRRGPKPPRTRRSASLQNEETIADVPYHARPCEKPRKRGRAKAGHYDFQETGLIR